MIVVVVRPLMMGADNDGGTGNEEAVDALWTTGLLTSMPFSVAGVAFAPLDIMGSARFEGCI
jgi:hypothetical protein